MADLDLDFPPVAPGSSSPEQAVNTGFAKVVAAIRALADGGEVGLPPGGRQGQFLAILPDGSVGWVDAPAGGEGGTGDDVLAACVCYLDQSGNVDNTKTKKNNIATITKIPVDSFGGAKYKFTFTTPLPDLDVHISASAQYGEFDDNWTTRVEFPRKASERLTVNQITLVAPNQNGNVYSPVFLEFRIIAFR